jgi:hypothetical protein
MTLPVPVAEAKAIAMVKELFSRWEAVGVEGTLEWATAGDPLLEPDCSKVVGEHIRFFSVGAHK